MKALIVHAHPDPSSFSAHLLTTVQDGLSEAGHEHRTLELYATDFRAAMSEDEWALHRRPSDVKPWTDRHHALLQWADSIVWMYPTWWSGPPAILKGWVDRIWTNGVAYHHTDKGLIPLSDDERDAVRVDFEAGPRLGRVVDDEEIEVLHLRPEELLRLAPADAKTLLAALEKDVMSGRSTDGPASKNDVPVVLWKEQAGKDTGGKRKNRKPGG